MVDAEINVVSTADIQGTTTTNAREALLGLFPVNEAEMDSLLIMYDRFGEFNDELSLSSLLHQNDRSFAFEKLPELVRIFQTAIDTVFVVIGSDYQDDASFHRKAKFLEASISLCGRRGDRFGFESIYLSSRGDDQNVVSSCNLASLVFRLCQACHRLQNTDDHESRDACQDLPMKWIRFFSTIGEKRSDVSLVEWRDWASRKIPCVAYTLSTVFQAILLGCEYPSLTHPFQMPVAQSSLPWANSHNSIPMQLGLMGLGGPWKPVFRSDDDGLSFRTFHEALIGFSSPTVILITTLNGERLGYFSDLPWKSSPNWFSGDGESFLFRLHPSWNVYCPKGDGLTIKYHQFLNLPVSNRKDSLVGLAVGGLAQDLPRFHISVSLEHCKASSYGSVFDAGPLLEHDEDSFFDIDSLEIWAVRFDGDDGFQRGVEAGELKATVAECARQRLAKVDRTQFVDDFTSGAFMNNLFQHRTQSRGRADFVADDKRGGYFVDGKQPSQRRSFDED